MKIRRTTHAVKRTQYTSSFVCEIVMVEVGVGTGEWMLELRHVSALYVVNRYCGKGREGKKKKVTCGDLARVFLLLAN